MQSIKELRDTLFHIKISYFLLGAVCINFYFETNLSLYEYFLYAFTFLIGSFLIFVDILNSLARSRLNYSFTLASLQAGIKNVTPEVLRSNGSYLLMPCHLQKYNNQIAKKNLVTMLPQKMDCVN